MTSAALTTPLTDAIAQFPSGRGYLAAASVGLPPTSTIAALRADLDAWAAAQCDPMCYDGIATSCRESYARIVGVDPSRVAMGSQTSVLVSLAASAVPDGAEVVVVDGDFSSIVFPFVQRAEHGAGDESGVRVRSVPLEALADALTDDTWMVVFSLIQSATGRIADVDAILEAARRHDVLTLCDLTQAAGVYPCDASLFDLTVGHSYKWLCAPRGVAFLTVSPAADHILRPLHANWYAGELIWGSIYGPDMTLATDARRFDVSPAWQAIVGAETSLDLFAGLDIAEVWKRTSDLGDALCDGLGIPQQHHAIVTWPDASGADLAKLRDAGLKVSGRAGRLRAAFHLWNDETCVDAVLKVLR